MLAAAKLTRLNRSCIHIYPSPSLSLSDDDDAAAVCHDGGCYDDAKSKIRKTGFRAAAIVFVGRKELNWKLASQLASQCNRRVSRRGVASSFRLAI